MAQAPRYSDNSIIQTIWASFHRALNSNNNGQLSFAEVTEGDTSRTQIFLNNRVIASLPFGTAEDMLTALHIISRSIDDWEVISSFKYEETAEETEFGRIEQRGWHIEFKKPPLGEQEKTNRELKELSKNSADALEIALYRRHHPSPP